MVVAHHPLLFHPLRHLGDSDYVERCVRYAIRNDISVYAAHTNLDNAQGGVSFALAERLGLKDLTFLKINDKGGGCGCIGCLTEPMEASAFISMIKDALGLRCAMHNALLLRPIRRVALCGGAGDFLLDDALAQGAYAFVTGEMHYHRYFGTMQRLQVVVTGHWESEQFAPALIQDVLRKRFTDLPLCLAEVNTNPIEYM